MAHRAITLSDGLPCHVRQLGLYELNGKGREILGPYRYSLLLATGQIVEDEYDLRALDYTPQAPDKPVGEVENGSIDWYDLQEYETYLAALAHEKLRIESYHGYVQDVIDYILANCVGEADRARIVTADDWDKIYQAALVPELTLEDITRCLGDVFRGFLQWTAHNGRPFWHLRRRGPGGNGAPVGV